MMDRIAKLKWLFLLVAVIVVNMIAAKVHYRFDLTEEKRYSITPATKELLTQLDSDVAIDIFLTGDMPAELKRLGNAAEEFVRELREAHADRIRYRIINPLDESPNGVTWADSLKKMGAAPINVNVQLKAGEETKVVFPYALLKYKDEQMLINLLQTSKRNLSQAEVNSAEAMMEYQYARAIDQLSNNRKIVVGYSTGYGEPTGAEAFSLRHAIDVESIDYSRLPEQIQQVFPPGKSHYELKLINLKIQPSIPEQIRVLLIVKPSQSFTDADKLKIDQFVMKGGKVVWFVDNLFAEQDSLSIKSQLIAYERGLNIEDLLFNYGVRINPDLVMDLQCDFLPFVVGGSRTEPQYEFLHWNYYPLFESRQNHLINKNLGLVSGRYVNSIDTIEKPGLTKTYLLQSSANSRSVSTPALISPNENRNAPQDVLFNRRDIPAAVLVEGKFTSLYRNRISQTQLDTLAQYGGFKEESVTNQMIIVADGDVVLNDVSPQQGPVPMGLNLFTIGTQYEYQFANRDFLLNCLEYITSKTSIISTRNKEIVLRMLDTRLVNEEKNKWQLISIALPILLLIVIGIIYRQVRTYQFTK